MQSDPDLAIELERRLLQPAVRADQGEAGALLHPDFVEFGRSGRVWSRETIVAAMASSPPVAGEATDFVATHLADDVVLLTYRIGGPDGSLRSSVWVRVDGRWQLRFHQGTPAPS